MNPRDDDRSGPAGDVSRRRVLASASAAVAAGLAGCSSMRLSDRVDSIPVGRSEGSRSSATRSGDRPSAVEHREEDGPRAAADFSEDVIESARSAGETLEASVVYLYKELERGSTTGTGWFIDERTIVTNGHVVTTEMYGDETYDEMTAFTSAGESFAVEPLAYEHGMVGDYHVDMAVLRSDRSGTPVTAGDEGALEVGQPLVQNGHPADVGNWVTSLGRFRGIERLWGVTSTVPTRSGNSGSPVATLDGAVVGLTSSTFAVGPDDSRPDETPKPADDTVYTSEGYREVVAEVTAHTPISTVREFVKNNS